MYPRVKATREKEDPKANEDTTRFLLRLVDSLSEQGHSFSRTPPSYGRYSENHPSTADAKSLRSLSKNSPIAYTCASKEMHTKKSGEDIRTNFRATFVSRPRAVLSSPENDELIGHQNRLMEERDALWKKQSMNQQQHIHGHDQLSHKAARVAKNSTERQKP
ncbi:uncharacterized protein LOC109729053 [Ananas comosus]|uniref:Uncharacterized protein LOC109729053 n=1 Tax=Ananas comosus TaxID=4615 RepID=A0A6P5H2V4_ANACO|nr:uncharacterized protein LOC109729053 [Ananas comosus]